jgi:TM2 domain-containing membrane protein YozV
MEIGGKNKWLMVVLAWLLGGFGVHCFMFGETKKAITRIVITVVTCGLGGVIGVIDAIMIALDKYTIDPEKLFF